MIRHWYRCDNCSQLTSEVEFLSSATYFVAELCSFDLAMSCDEKMKVNQNKLNRLKKKEMNATTVLWSGWRVT